jgi:hypothetical protein
MTTIQIELPDELARQVRDAARAAGVSPEEWLRAGVEERLGYRADDFEAAARHVLTKNAELYRRLA